jgi:hypothetical protein
MTAKTHKTLDAQYSTVQTLLSSIRSQMESAYNASASGRSAKLIIDDYRTIGSLKTQLEDYAAVPGLTAYADTTEGGGYDSESEFAAVSSQLGSVLSWVEANFPSTLGYVQALSLSGGEVSWRTFSGTALAGYRTELQSVIDLIEP